MYHSKASPRSDRGRSAGPRSAGTPASFGIFLANLWNPAVKGKSHSRSAVEEGGNAAEDGQRETWSRKSDEYE
ncbi:hypothetical protein CLCR_03781 [Cladophialophora carrionii]|uniref:Uncharacterized protein n=1 Tax=Cladophialophora carrionii TaxID=86049 RepID=A0A1C1CGB6_9EURO|nr:hypothetical protein CLCR_03781 [Cladophialophora carrionii]